MVGSLKTVCLHGDMLVKDIYSTVSVLSVAAWLEGIYIACRITIVTGRMERTALVMTGAQQVITTLWDIVTFPLHAQPA